MIAILVLLAAAWLEYSSIGTDFLPSMDEGSIILDYWTPPGTSLTDTDAMLVEAEKVIASLPDVAGYSRRTGVQLGFSLTEANKGDYVIQLKARRQRRPVDEVIARGRVYISNASIRGKFALRACFVNHRTTDADVDAVVQEVLAAAREVS